MRLLAMETTGPAASVCLWEDGALRGAWYQNTALTHSETLLAMTELLLQNAGLSCRQLDRIAVAAGPGSFTGVRIGVAAAKGLALPWEIPCAGVSTLDALARLAPPFPGVVCAALDARCRQTYCALFSVTEAGCERLTEDRALTLSELEAELKKIGKSVFLLGDGAELCYNNWNRGGLDLTLAPAHRRFQHASGVALAAAEAKAVSPDGLLPLYLRLPQAERERIQKMEGKGS